MNIYEGSLRKLSRAAWFPLGPRSGTDAARHAPQEHPVRTVEDGCRFPFVLCHNQGSPVREAAGGPVVLHRYRTRACRRRDELRDHPGWSYNLDADPAAIVEVGGESFEATAHRLSDADAKAVWPKFEQFWPAYEDYRQIAPRHIKMYVLQLA